MTHTRPVWLQMTMLLLSSVLTCASLFCITIHELFVFTEPARLLSFLEQCTYFLGYFLLVSHIDVFLSLRFDCNAVVCWSMFNSHLSGKRKPWLIAFD